MNKILYYIGTYTWKESKGIYGTYKDPVTGQFSQPELFAELVSPTYMVFNNKGTVLYANSETVDRTNGKVAAYAIDSETGKLNKINEITAPGLGLCHVSIDSTDSYLFGVSYSDATVQVYPLNEDGSIREVVCVKEHVGKGTNPKRQEKAHAHQAILTPDEKFLCVCDLGIDKLMVYGFDSKTGQLQLDQEKTLKLPDGCGPRHMTFHNNGKTAYLLAELSSQVFGLAYQPDKGFTVEQTINALEQENPSSIAAAIRISPNGKYLYSSNRGEDSLSLFRIDEETGLLEYVSATETGGQHPRDFILADSLLLCANQDTDNILIFEVSEGDGSLKPIREITGVSMPVSILEYPLR